MTFSTTIARCSFILYLLAILGNNKQYRYALWAVMLIQLGGNIASAVLPLSICRNVNILWDPTTITTCGDVTAVIKFAYYSNSLFLSRAICVWWFALLTVSGANSACDLFLAVFPTLIFWNLNLKLRVKIGLIALLSLGLVYVLLSFFLLSFLATANPVQRHGCLHHQNHQTRLHPQRHQHRRQWRRRTHSLGLRRKRNHHHHLIRTLYSTFNHFFRAQILQPRLLALLRTYGRPNRPTPNRKRRYE